MICMGKQLETLSTEFFSVKGDVKRLTENGVQFKDGSYQNFTTIIFATGIIL